MRKITVLFVFIVVVSTCSGFATSITFDGYPSASVAGDGHVGQVSQWRPTLGSATLEPTSSVMQAGRSAERVKAFVDDRSQLPLGGPVTGAIGRLDGDAALDLVVSRRVNGGGGALVVYLGNPDYRLSYWQKVEMERLGYGRPAPFVETARVVRLPVEATEVLIGDFTGDGAVDIVAGAYGLDRLMVLEGDGTGRFDGAVVEVPLGAPLTAIASGEVNRRDGVVDLAVAVADAGGARVLVFQSALGALQTEPDVRIFERSVTELGMGQVDLGHPSLVAVSANELFILPGRDTRRDLSGIPERGRAPVPAAKVTVPAAIADMMVADLAGDGLAEVAMLSSTGEIWLASGVGGDTTLRRSAPVGEASRSKLLAAALGGSHRSLVVAQSGGCIEVGGSANAEKSLAGLRLSSVDPNSVATAVLAGRLDRDAIDEFVYLLDDQSDPLVVNGTSATPLVVNDPGDAGGATCGTTCTLRQAINQSNADAGVDTIVFSVGLSSVISPATALPAINDAVIIDGTEVSGPFLSWPTKIEGSACGPTSCQGFTVTAGGSTIDGLIIFGFSGAGIWLQSGANTVTNCRLGNLADGVSNAGNNIGVSVYNASNNVIGGVGATDRNYVAGNHNEGIRIIATTTPSATMGNQVIGNYVGVDLSGTAARHNVYAGVSVRGALANTVGESGGGNVVSGGADSASLFPGVEVRSSSGVLVQANVIGLAQGGVTALPNWVGVEVTSSTDVTLGGAVVGQGNTISGNTLEGIRVNTGATGTDIVGNLVGVASDGSTSVGNGGDGVAIADSVDTFVGGTSSAQGNVIAHNSQYGVDINGDETTTGNRVQANRIFDNGALGIDIGDTGVTANDPLDADVGVNSLQNHPLVAGANPDSGQVDLTLSSLPSSSFTLHLYSSAGCDASGYGEGAEYLGSVAATTNSSGNAAVSAYGLSFAAGEVLTAMATHTSGNTSEFSPCFTVADPSLIFEDGFESGNLTAWSSAVN